MKRKKIHEILSKVKNGEISVDKAIEMLKDLPFKDMGFAKIDYHRELRKNMPEAILCKGKTPKQIVEIFREMKGKCNIIATKASKEIIDLISENFPEARIYKDAGIIFLGEFPKKKNGKIVVLTGGTADIPVATEAVVTSRAMGVEAETIFDVGVAGLHRLFSFKEKIAGADVLVVVAGMEGALASVVAGLFDVPVIAVPTSVGYGASFEGLSSLLTMLNSCAPGVVVVNIDNGYGAGYFASLIAGRCKK